MAEGLSKELLEHLVDPETREPVRQASEAELDVIRKALTDGTARRRDGGDPPPDFEGAFVTKDGLRAYLVVDGIPNFLIDERIELDRAIGARG